MGGRGASSINDADAKIVNSVVEQYRENVKYNTVSKLKTSGYWLGGIETDINRAGYDYYTRKGKDFTVKKSKDIMDKVLKELKKYEKRNKEV